MADLKGVYRSPNGSPYFDYDISYSETNRTGSNAKYRVNLRVRMTSSQSRYGYGMRAYVKINGAKVEKQIKNASPMWSGSGWQGTWTFDVTASAGTGGGTLPAEVKVWGTDGGSAPNMTIGGKTVSLSTWNTAPYWTSDDGNMNGWKQHKIIPENTGKVHIYPPKAADREGNRINFDTWRYVNDQNTAKVCQNGTVDGFEDDISAYGQGSKIKYQFRVDDYNAFSDYRWSWTYTKNQLTPANISVGSGISFDTSEISVNFNGQSNTDGNTNFTFTLTSPNVTINNGVVNGNTTIKIHKGGNVPSGPYINFEDLKNLTKNSNWQGNITLNVETKNAYGSKASKSTTVSIDLRTNPNATGTPNAGGQISIAGGSYFIPSKGAISLNWSAGSDKLGGPVTYDVLGTISGGQWTTLKSGLTNTSTSINLDAVTKVTDYVIKIVTRTNFGYSTESGVKTIALHYYNQPKVYIQNSNRSANAFSCDIIVSKDTSISAVALTSTQYQDKNGNWHGFAGSSYRMNIGGLTETDSFSRQIKVVDNAGQPESTVVYNYQVTSYVPIFSIRKKGVGVNTLADDVNKFKVAGRARAWAWVNEGYETYNSGGENVNKWVKIASFRVPGRYGDASATIDFLNSGSGSNNPVSGRIRCRLKQQNEMGQESNLGLILENPINCSVNDFYLVVTKNTAQEVIAELWYRCSMSYTTVYFYPSQSLGEVTMYAHQPFQNGIPAGQNKKAEYSNIFTDYINGKPIGTSSHDTLGDFIPFVRNDGVMEVGKFIDFHPVGGKDFCPRLEAYDNGLSISGDFVLTNGNKIITSNNYGVMGKLKNGGEDYMLYMGEDNAIKLGYNNRPIDIQTNTLKANGISLIKTSEPLWTGAWFLLDGQTITPKKKLSECVSGWVLVWSDYDTGVGPNNYNYYFSFIPKYGFNPGCNVNLPVTSGEGPGTVTKTMYIWDDHFVGHTKNDENGADDVCIRAVYEF